MKIENTPWQTVAVTDEQKGGYELGYEAPASVELLRQLQKDNILVQVVGEKNSTGGKFGSSLQYIRPENTDSRTFTPDQKFRIMEANGSFKRFENILKTALENRGNTLPDDRFDGLVKWTDPKMYEKRDKGYSLRVSPLLSYDGKKALKEDVADYATSVGDDKVLVQGKKATDLESVWKWAAGQSKAGSGMHTIPLGEIKSRRDY